MLENILLLTNCKDEQLIKLYIKKAKDEVVNYCNLQAYSNKLDNVVEDIVVLKINQRGAEGLTNQSYSGASEGYINGYTDTILKQLEKFRVKVAII